MSLSRRCANATEGNSKTPPESSRNALENTSAVGASVKVIDPRCVQSPGHHAHELQHGVSATRYESLIRHLSRFQLRLKSLDECETIGSCKQWTGLCIGDLAGTGQGHSSVPMQFESRSHTQGRNAHDDCPRMHTLKVPCRTEHQPILEPLVVTSCFSTAGKWPRC